MICCARVTIAEGAYQSAAGPGTEPHAAARAHLTTSSLENAPARVGRGGRVFRGESPLLAGSSSTFVVTSTLPAGSRLASVAVSQLASCARGGVPWLTLGRH